MALIAVISLAKLLTFALVTGNVLDTISASATLPGLGQLVIIQIAVG